MQVFRLTQCGETVMNWRKKWFSTRSPVRAFRHSVNPVYYYHGDLVCTKWTLPTWGEVGSDSDRVDQNAHCSGWVQWNVLASMYFIFDFCIPSCKFWSRIDVLFSSMVFILLLSYLSFFSFSILGILCLFCEWRNIFMNIYSIECKDKDKLLIFI